MSLAEGQGAQANVARTGARAATADAVAAQKQAPGKRLTRGQRMTQLQLKKNTNWLKHGKPRREQHVVRSHCCLVRLCARVDRRDVWLWVRDMRSRNMVCV